MVFVFGFISCQKEGIDVEYKYYEDYALISEHLDLPEAPFPYKIDFPEYYRVSSNVNFNPDLATLGRVLFYDTNLSKDASISCASCHKQEIGFSDDVAFSKGVFGAETDRNSLALGSVFSFNEYYGSISSNRIPFFWDNRASSVQDQSTETFANAKEMDMEMHEVIAAVKEQPYYEPLFKAAFGSLNTDSRITDTNILDAIGEFINSIANVDSKFDEEMTKRLQKENATFSDRDRIAKLDFDGFSAKENLGKRLYVQNCASCHSAVNERPAKPFANNGLDTNYDDKGIGAINGSYSDGNFKVPTLRNISLTAPYMHDGRFATLGDVIDHYSNGIQDHRNLDIDLKNFDNTPKQFNFTEEEKEALIAFFETLTDEKMLTDEKYSDPFKK